MHPNFNYISAKKIFIEKFLYKIEICKIIYAEYNVSKFDLAANVKWGFIYTYCGNKINALW